MTKYGYVRVSSVQQKKNFSLETQTQQLLAVGILPLNIVKEQASATTVNRQKLNELLQKLKSGDSLTVTRFDRFARTTWKGFDLVNQLQQKGIHFHDLSLNMDNSKPHGQLIMFISAWLAEQENVMRKERQFEGIQKAKQLGKYKGRPSKISQELYQNLITKKNAGFTIREILKKFKIGKTTYYKCIKAYQKTQQF